MVSRAEWVNRALCTPLQAKASGPADHTPVVILAIETWFTGSCSIGNIA